MVKKNIFTVLAIMLTFWLGYSFASQTSDKVDYNMEHSKAKPRTLELAVELLKFEEGYSSTPYLGTEGYLHIGYGQKLSNKKGLDPKDFKGRTTPKHAEYILTNLVKSLIYRFEHGVHKYAFLSLSAERQAIIISMAYQMGIEGVLKFKRTWTKIYLGDFNRAAYAMLQSKWATQTPNRARRHAETMRTGKLP